MLTVVNATSIAFAIVLSIPATVLFVECTFAAIGKGRRSSRTNAQADNISYPRTAVVIPAHNESTGIGAVIKGLKRQLHADDRLIVVADNCTDSTAKIARDSGAEVVERVDSQKRGKGYAIAFAISYLRKAPPEVVVLLDADCLVSDGTISMLADQARRRDRPVQGEYLLVPADQESTKALISSLALILRNIVRPQGLDYLGFPCHLTGSGMAFPWHILEASPSTGSNLVEDLVMGIEMALAGFPPSLNADVKIRSDLPADDTAAIGQRKRWEHGHLATIARYFPRLMTAGVLRRRLALIALALDLCVPPLALLALLYAAFLVVFGFAAQFGLSKLPLLIATGSCTLAAAAIGIAWFWFARRTIPFGKLMGIPAYILWKLPSYASFLIGRKQGTWERTTRKHEHKHGK